jgi:hypothetical protein
MAQLRRFLTPPQATQERLAKASQRVVVKNIDPMGSTDGIPAGRTFTIMDRYKQPQNFKPGDRREVELLVEDIENLVKQREVRYGIDAETYERVEMPKLPLILEGLSDETAEATDIQLRANEVAKTSDAQRAADRAGEAARRKGA